MSNFQLNIPSAAETDALAARWRRLEADCLHCGFEPSAEERAETFADVDKPLRRDALMSAVEARQGAGDSEPSERNSAGLIVEQAAHRFFEVAATVEPKLKGRFTEAEFMTILNSTCSPIWYWDRYTTVASMVADDQGVHRIKDLETGHPLRVLLEKLLKLSSIENAVLVDVCERVWRGYDNPLL